MGQCDSNRIWYEIYISADLAAKLLSLIGLLESKRISTASKFNIILNNRLYDIVLSIYTFLEYVYKSNIIIYK